MKSLPSRYNAKIWTIEEARDLSKITIDDLRGILIAYEMGMDGENTSKRVVVFKATKKTKEVSSESDCDINEACKAC